MDALEARLSIVDLLASAGLETRNVEVEAGGGGGNNRVFIVHSHDGKYLAKSYYSHPADTRNRLAAEFAFLSYAKDIGLRCVPRPVACNAEKNIGLYEFVDGKKLTVAELDISHVAQAASFLRELNALSHRLQANKLPAASEACFSIEQHFALVDRRFDRLRTMPMQSEIERQALTFVTELAAIWQRVKTRIQTLIGNNAVAAVLDHADRCLSPSDFGFHNALVRESGEICFIDFEYAGWDDPAKTIGDFFCQPAIPVSLDYFGDFAERAMDYLPNGNAVAERAQMLLPIFQLKWCCIMLNEFLPDAANRRRFANADAEPEIGKRRQLDKAQQFFNSMVRKSWHT